MTAQNEVQFILRCPTVRISDLRAALDRIGLSFDPEEDQCFLSPDSVLDGVFTGSQGQECIERINEYLEESGSPERITARYGQIGWDERRRLLAFLNSRVIWRSEYGFPVDEIPPGDLRTFIQENEELFMPREQWRQE